MSNNFEKVIGLEIHIKLKSPNKLWCQCKNEQEFDELEANQNICPVCMGQPGALPVLNKEPLEKAVLLGHAMHCKINEISGFERKSYFYPDSPANYQITQLEVPTNGEGYVRFFTDDYQNEVKVGIERAHIENDAGKTIHENGEGILDYNRAGTPLVEIVTNPDFRSEDEVVEFLKELQRRIRFNNIGNADLEKGQMRVDVNLSIRKPGEEYGTRTEMKNMNSYGAIKRAIQHEFKRQIEIIESGKKIDQETRGRDDSKTSSYTMRSKEDALDYRYFPEPDLPPLKLDMNWVKEIEKQIVESPYLRIKRYKEQYNFNKEYINALIQNFEINDYFENTIQNGIKPEIAAKWMIGYLLRFVNDNNVTMNELKFSFDQFLNFLKLIQDGKLMDAQAKQVVMEMFESGKDAENIIKEKGLEPADRGEIEKIIDEVIADNPNAIQDLKDGQMKSIGFLIGQVMQKSGGKANPKEVKDIIEGKI